MNDFQKSAIYTGYMQKQAVAGPFLTALLSGLGKTVGGAAGGIASGIGSGLKGIFDMGTAAISGGAKMWPVAAGAPLLGGAALGYLASKATAPSGEDREEAIKHLEEQALEQFKADIQRQKEVRDFARKTLLERADAMSGKREREIRL